jgi:hypothetical protein
MGYLLLFWLLLLLLRLCPLLLLLLLLLLWVQLLLGVTMLLVHVVHMVLRCCYLAAPLTTSTSQIYQRLLLCLDMHGCIRRCSSSCSGTDSTNSLPITGLIRTAVTPTAATAAADAHSTAACLCCCCCAIAAAAAFHPYALAAAAHGSESFLH